MTESFPVSDVRTEIDELSSSLFNNRWRYFDIGDITIRQTGDQLFFNGFIPLNLLLDDTGVKIDESGDTAVTTVRERLGLTGSATDETRPDLGTIRVSRSPRMMSFYLEDVTTLTESELLFMRALPFVDEDRTVETAMRQLREGAQVGLAQTIEVSPVEEQKESDFYSFLNSIEREQTIRYDIFEKIGTDLFAIQTVRTFVEAFNRYQKILTISNENMTIKQRQAIRVIEREIERLYRKAATSMQLGTRNGTGVTPSAYSLIIATEPKELYEEGFHHDYPYKPVKSLESLTMEERRSAKLVLVPGVYVERRREAFNSEFHAAAEPWF